MTGLSAPIFARLLGPVDFGVYDVLTVVYGLGSVVLLLGLDQALLRFYVMVTDDAGRRAVVWFALGVPIAASSAVVLVAAVWREPLSDLLLGDPGNGGALVASAAAVLCMNAAYLSQEVLRVRKATKGYARSTLLRSVVAAAAGLAFVQTGFGVAGIFAGMCIGASLALLSNGWSVRSALLPARLDADLNRAMLTFGVLLVPATVSQVAIMLADRLLLVRMVDLDDVGHYGLANKVAGLLLLVVYGFYAGWTAYALERHTADAAAERQLRGRIMTAYLALLLMLGAWVSALSPEVIRLVAGDEFEPAADLVPVLALAFVFFGTVHVSQVPLLARSRTRVVSLLALGATALDVGLCLLLVPVAGAQGAGLATLVALAALAVGLPIANRRAERNPYEVGRLITLLVVAVPAYGLGFLQHDNLAVSALGKSAVVGVVVLALARLAELRVSTVRRLLRGVPAEDRKN